MFTARPQPRPQVTPAAGFVAAQVLAEHPGLRLRHATVAHRPGTSPPELVARLRALSDRFRAEEAIAARTKGAARAYRAFFRQVGLDPDASPIPSERAATTRLLAGQWRSQGLPADACLVALIETGVPVWALDADLVDGAGLGIRLAEPADADRGRPGVASPGTIVVADGSRVHAQLFGDIPAASAPGRGTTGVTLFTVAVAGVPELHAREALWCALELL